MRFLTLCVTVLCLTLWSNRRLDAQSVAADTGNLRYVSVFMHGSYLGVRLADIDANRAKMLKLPQAEGVEVTEVEPGSPAEKAGLRKGDVLLTYNGANILGAEHLARLVAETPTDRRIKIRYSRNGNEQTAVVVTATREEGMLSYGGFPPPPSSPELLRRLMTDMPAPLLLWKTSIGIECEPLDNQLAKYFGVSHGVLVRSVDQDSPGEKAGLRAGDIVTMFGRQSVSSPKDVTGILRANRSGKPIPVTVTREHRQMQMTIKPSANGEE
ncbi:MAG TPA: PDZ domain-containing protein [Bryobacteraceae bacterium]